MENFQPAGQTTAEERDGAAERYLRRMFPDGGERIAILAVPRDKETESGVIQRFPTVGQAANPKYQGWLRHLNARDYDIYLSVNPVKAGAGGRTKKDIAVVRRIQLDLDEDGPDSLKRIMRDAGRGELPTPAFVLRSSENRYQVLWNADAGKWSAPQAEDLMSRLADKYGGDQAATDVSRVMRLPGFRNKKAERGDAVVSWADHGGGPVKAEAFRDLPEIRKTPTRGGERKRSSRGANSQSERDWAYVRESLRNGAEPDALIEELVEQRQDKPDPRDYATRTVTRAVDSLSLEREGGRTMEITR